MLNKLITEYPKRTESNTKSRTVEKQREEGFIDFGGDQELLIHLLGPNSTLYWDSLDYYNVLAIESKSL